LENLKDREHSGDLDIDGINENGFERNIVKMWNVEHVV
jgi:hypothetical protein